MSNQKPPCDSVWPCSVCSKRSSVAVILNPVSKEALAFRAMGCWLPWPGLMSGFREPAGTRAVSFSEPYPSSPFFFLLFFLAWPRARAVLWAGRAGEGQGTLCAWDSRASRCQQPASACLGVGQRRIICWCKYPGYVLCSAQPSQSQTGTDVSQPSLQPWLETGMGELDMARTS